MFTRGSAWGFTANTSALSSVKITRTRCSCHPEWNTKAQKDLFFFVRLRLIAPSAYRSCHLREGGSVGRREGKTPGTCKMLTGRSAVSWEWELEGCELSWNARSPSPPGSSCQRETLALAPLCRSDGRFSRRPRAHLQQLNLDVLGPGDRVTQGQACVGR